MPSFRRDRRRFDGCPVDTFRVERRRNRLVDVNNKFVDDFFARFSEDGGLFDLVERGEVRFGDVVFGVDLHDEHPNVRLEAKRVRTFDFVRWESLSDTDEWQYGRAENEFGGDRHYSVSHATGS